MDSGAFSQATFPREWLIDRILVLGQPGVVGGPKKVLKTSIIVDMVVSLGSGRPFLGRFAVPRRRRVAVFSGESDAATLQETARRVCAARRVPLADCTVHWALTLPRLNHAEHRLALRNFLHENKVQVVFIDPLYLCLAAGSRPVTATNLYEIGPLLWDAARTCLDAGATPIFAHHATKAAAKRPRGPAESLDLDDLAFAGIGEFARQWVLLARQEPFRPDLGRHRILMTAGGSAGHSGAWELTIDEGVVRQDFAGRKWEVQVGRADHADERPGPGRGRGSRPFAGDWVVS
jgi:replicative DNA helicase